MDEDFNNDLVHYSYSLFCYQDDWYISYDYRNEDYILYRRAKIFKDENELEEEYSIETYRSKILSLCIQFGMENFVN